MTKRMYKIGKDDEVFGRVLSLFVGVDEELEGDIREVCVGV